MWKRGRPRTATEVPFHPPTACTGESDCEDEVKPSASTHGNGERATLRKQRVGVLQTRGARKSYPRETQRRTRFYQTPPSASRDPSPFLSDSRMWVSPFVCAEGRSGRTQLRFKSERAVGGTNVETAEAGRRVGGDARARPRPEVTAGRLGGALAAAR